MNAKEIVNELAKNKTVEKIARHYKTPYREDLCQYIYYWLLTKTDENMLNELYSNGQINQYISGIVYRQIFSDHSHHYCQNVKRIGEPIIKQNKDGDTYDETLIYDDTQPHQLQDEVVEFLNTLPEAEKEIAWLFPMLNYDKEKKEEIDIILHNYNLTYNQYQKLLPKIKKKFQEHFKKGLVGKKFEPRIKDEVVQEDTAGNIIAIYDNLRDAADKLGFSIDSIRRCRNSDRKTYKGFIFKFKKNI